MSALSVMFSVRAACADGGALAPAPIADAGAPASAAGARIASSAAPAATVIDDLTIGTFYPSQAAVATHAGRGGEGPLYSSSASVGETRAACKTGTAASASTIAITSTSNSSGRRPAVRVTIGKPVTLRR